MDDVYTWIAHYRDGGMLAEIDDQPWASVDQSRLVAIEIVPCAEGFAPIGVQVGDCVGVFFRRRSIEIDMTTGEQTASTITVIGRDDGLTKNLLYIYPDGSISMVEEDA